MTMRTIRYEFLLEAVEPIAHHSESFGNSAIFMRRKVRQPDGSFVSLPVVTADTMRHGLREAATYALLDAAGLLDNPLLSEGALRLLFAGGMITGRGDGSAVRLDQYRELVELLPHVALLGGCAGNRCIPGRLTVGDAQLVCDEQLHLLPGWVHLWLTDKGAVTDTHRAYVEEVQRVRMDPGLNPNKRLLLSDGARAGIEGRLLKSEAATEAGDAIAREDAKSTMMPRRFETVVQGSLFFWRVSATCYSELDVDTYHLALATFLHEARVGGKRGTGHGLLRPVAAQRIELAPPAEQTEADVGAAVAPPSPVRTEAEMDPAHLEPAPGVLFRAHVRERSARIASFLETVDA